MRTVRTGGDTDVDASWTCEHCKVTGAIRAEVRPEPADRNLYSLAGYSIRIRGQEWPYAVCHRDKGGCGHEWRAERISWS